MHGSPGRAPHSIKTVQTTAIHSFNDEWEGQVNTAENLSHTETCYRVLTERRYIEHLCDDTSSTCYHFISAGLSVGLSYLSLLRLFFHLIIFSICSRPSPQWGCCTCVRHQRITAVGWAGPIFTLVSRFWYDSDVATVCGIWFGSLCVVTWGCKYTSLLPGFHRQLK